MSNISIELIISLVREAGRKGRLSPVQLHILAAIQTDPGCPIGHVSRVTGIAYSQVSREAGQLERKGYLALVRSSEDRRIVNCYLTKEINWATEAPEINSLYQMIKGK